MNDLTRALLADTRNIARDQIERIFEERMTALMKGVEQAVAESLAATRRELTGKLNQAVRRLRDSESDAQWSKAVVDATHGFCDRAALFTLDGQTLHLEAARHLAGAVADVSLDQAAAFSSAAHSKDTIVALRSKSEMSQPIAQWAGESEDGRFYLFPIAARNRVVALLYADAAAREVETNGLELLATIAGAVIETRATSKDARDGFVQIGAASGSSDQDLSLRARRFARKQVAEIRLYQSENVKNGRAGRNLYTSLKEEIDSARDVFRREFLSGSGEMKDYLHLELVQTLANDDVELLGPGYPGPMA